MGEMQVPNIVPPITFLWDDQVGNIHFAVTKWEVSWDGPGRLKVVTHTHFIDSSGRPDYIMVGFFIREAGS